MTPTPFINQKIWNVILQDLGVFGVLFACIVFNTVAFGAGILDHPKKYEIYDKAGHRVVYESKEGYEYENSKELVCCYGVISIFSKKNELIFFQKDAPIPNCVGSDYETPHFLPKNPEWDREIIVLCGDKGGAGNHITLSFLENGYFIGSLEVGGNELPNVLWGKKYKTYQTVGVYRRNSQFQGLDSYFVVYEWDGLTGNWFRPIFNQRSKSVYLEKYLFTKKYVVERIKKNGYDWKGVIADGTLASLIATSDKKLICSELQTPPFSQFSKKDIQGTISFNEQYGYPSFNISTCGGK